MRISNIINCFQSEDKQIAEKNEMFFDWELAARIIEHMKPNVAYEILENNPEKTTIIYQNGIPVYNSAVHSKTEKPMMIVDDKKPVQCFKIAQETMKIGTWTKEAIKMLEGKI